MGELDELFTRMTARSAVRTSQHLADVRQRAEALAVRRLRQRSVAGAVIVVVVAVLGVVAVASPLPEPSLEVGGVPVPGSTTTGTRSSNPGTRSGPGAVDPLPADLLPSPAHVVGVRAFGTVVDIPGHPLQLCFNIRPQAPPDQYCRGLPLTGPLNGMPPLEPVRTPEGAGSTGTAPGTAPAAVGVRSTGIVTVTARYDGSSLLSTAPIVPGIDAATDRDYPSFSGCPSPPGGWVPARRGSPAAAENLARSLPGYQSSRLTGPLGLSPLDSPATRDVGPDGSLLLVSFADRAAENEARLREAYDGPLCVTTARPTSGPPAVVRLCQDVARLRCQTMGGDASGRLRLFLVYGDQRIADWFAGNHPDGPYELVSDLHPLS